MNKVVGAVSYRDQVLVFTENGTVYTLEFSEMAKRWILQKALLQIPTSPP